MPSTAAKTTSAPSPTRAGRRRPQRSPSGMMAKNSPSMNSAKPTTTARIPRAICANSAIGAFSTKSWNKAR